MSTARRVFDVRFSVYAPNGNRLGLLPKPLEWNVGIPLNDVSALQLSYSSLSPAAALLNVPCEVALEYSADNGSTWTEPVGGRFLRLKRTLDRTDSTGKVTYDLPGYAWLLRKALVYPSAFDVDQRRPFSNVTVGTILATLLYEAQHDRGAIPSVMINFNNTNDSGGVAWGATVAITYDRGQDLLSVLQGLADQDILDFTTTARTLTCYKTGGGLSRDYSVGAAPVTLRLGRDLSDAPDTGTIEDLASDLLVLGDGGASTQLHNAAASAPWGRWESMITQGGVSDVGTMTALGQAQLNLSSKERVESTRTVTFERAMFLPFVDYRIGDLVLAPNAEGVLSSQRIRQITLSGSMSGGAMTHTAALVLNDRFLDRALRIQRRVAAITSGSTSGGGSGGTPTPPSTNTLPPAQVTGLTLGSVAYIDTTGHTKAQITVSWTAVTTNSDGTAIGDLDKYEVWDRKNATGTTWHLASSVQQPDVSVTLSPFDSNESWLFRVRAIDTDGHAGAWSNQAAITTATDATPPANPSAPILSSALGTITVRWDGKDENGNAMSSDFDHVEVHMGTAAAFTVSSATQVDALFQATSTVVSGQPGGATRYFKFRAADHVGNLSGVGAEASIVVVRIAGPDIQANSVTTNEIQAGAIHADDIALGILGRNLVPDPSFEEDYEVMGSLTANYYRWRRHTLSAGSFAYTKKTLGRARSGSYALCLTTNNDTSQVWVRSGVAPVVPGTQYTICVHAASVTAVAGMVVRVPGGSTMDLTEYPAGGSSDQMPLDDLFELVAPPIATPPLVDTDFAEYSTTFTVPAGVTWIAVQIGQYHVGTSVLVVDDVSVVPTGTGGAELTAAGLRLFGADGRELSAFVNNRPDFFAVEKDGASVASVGQDGSASFYTLDVKGYDTNADDESDAGMVIFGTEFREWLLTLPQGVVAYGMRNSGSSATTTEQPFLEVQADIKPDRLYRVSTNSFLVAGDTSGQRITCNLRYTTDGTTPGITSYLMTASTINSDNATNWYGMPKLEHYYGWLGGGATRDFRALLSVLPSSGTAHFVGTNNYPVTLAIEDCGPFLGDVGIDRTGGTPPPTRKNYVTTWASTASGTWRGNGTKRGDTTDVVQGYYSINGDGRGLWVFPTSLATAMSGATVTKVEVYAYANHWWYNAGGTALIKVHGLTSVPSSMPSMTNAVSSANWPHPGGRWVTLPSSFNAGFANGTYKGFGMGPAGTTSGTYYGRFNGGTASRLRISYTK